jgi:hypothetical protein
LISFLTYPGFKLFIALLLLLVLSQFNLIFQLILFFLGLITSFLINCQVLQLFKKIKFFILAIFVIFSFSVPGEVLFFYSIFSVSYEGIEQAIFYSIRLINTFLIIMCLLKVTPRETLLIFLSKAAFCFKVFGIDHNKLSLRLYLTFDYFEKLKDHTFSFKNFSSDLKKILDQNHVLLQKTYINRVVFGWNDFFWLASLVSTVFIINFVL